MSFQDSKTIQLFNNSTNDIQEIAELLQRAKHSHDQQESLDLLRGIIHECDKLVRMMHLNQSKQTTKEFYYYYSQALLRLGFLSPLDEFLDFIHASMDQIELGLEKNPLDETDASFQAFLIQAQAHLLLILSTETLNHELAEKAYNLLSINKDSKYFDEQAIVDMALTAQKYADASSNDWEITKKWNLFSIELLSKIATSTSTESSQDSKKQALAFIEIGQAYLNLANFYALDDQEDDDDDMGCCSDPDAAREWLDKAVISLTKGLDLSADQAQGWALLGEVYIYLGNLCLEDEEAMNSYYQMAVTEFKKCLDLDPDSLPDHFLDFMADLEASQDERSNNIEIIQH